MIRVDNIHLGNDLASLEKEQLSNGKQRRIK